jgi:8-oxo-dGTP diphosphatase
MKLKNYEALKGLIQYKNKFLIIETKGFVGGRYEIPGGRKKPRENEKIALKREVMEEVGLEIRIIRLLNTWFLDLPEKGIHLDGKTYLCKSDSNQVRLSGEHINYLWVSKEELKKLDVPFWLKDGISKL